MPFHDEGITFEDLDTDDHPAIELANARSFVVGRAMAPAEAGLVDSGSR